MTGSRWLERCASTAAVIPLALAACLCRGSTSAESPTESRAAETFARHCAVCHGPSGRGDGPARTVLFPPARDFSPGRFLLASTTNGVPSDADLVSTLARGMPGSAMPAWNWMGEDELTALASHVRRLAIRGLAERTRAADGAVQALAPGPSVSRPGQRHYAAASPDRGRALYRERCAACHGDDGRGQGIEPLRSGDGKFRWACDFTGGFLKGGTDLDSLACRIRVGMPGSTMAGQADLRLEDVAAIAMHLRGMIPADAEERTVQRQGELDAHRVAAPGPAAPDDPRWDAARELEVVLTPLAWHADAVFRARLRAVHDGARLYVRVEWADDTRDDSALEGARELDGLALAFSNEAAPPLFGMGSPQSPVNLWHWKPARWIDAEGLLDLVEPTVHAWRDPAGDAGRPDVRPLYAPALGAAASSGGVHQLAGEATGSVRALEEGGAVVVAGARWEAGRWSVVLSRTVVARAPGEADFAPGRPVLATCAVWNGSTGDRCGSKSIGIWQRLVIE